MTGKVHWICVECENKNSYERTVCLECGKSADLVMKRKARGRLGIK